MSLAEVRLWGRMIGAVRWDASASLGYFEYTPEFEDSGIQVAPLTMPTGERRIWSFPALPRETYYGLPGMLADALPDRFGNAVIDAWLATRGRAPGSFNPVERLCYTGARAMGALEFVPARGPGPRRGRALDVEALVQLAGEILGRRGRLDASLHDDTSRAMQDILRVGTSAGGARAKAVIAWNPDTGEVRSGEVAPRPGFSQWLIKFDGVAGNRDRELLDPRGFGLVEYAYHRMARAAGIQMADCRVLSEGGRHHFMTRRFDREDDGGKLHMQTLCGMGHHDFNAPGSCAYEQAMQLQRRLGMPLDAVEEQFRRMVFNILARNQDDHTKNIAYLMNKSGDWSLAPAYDLTFSYNPDGRWTSSHQMSMNGRRDGFDAADFDACGRAAGLARGRAGEILEQVGRAVASWPRFAGEAGVPADTVRRIGAAHRRIAPPARRP